MARVRVTHSIGDLSSDLAAMPAKMVKGGSKVVRKNVREGNAYARSFARGASGIHGKNYFKRITAEMTGPLSGEYGPHDGGTPVGGGWRHAPPNTDLEKSQDVIGPQFAREIGEMVDGLFW